jgi:hypothetical protein
MREMGKCTGDVKTKGIKVLTAEARYSYLLMHKLVIFI